MPTIRIASLRYAFENVSDSARDELRHNEYHNTSVRTFTQRPLSIGNLTEKLDGSPYNITITLDAKAETLTLTLSNDFDSATAPIKIFKAPIAEVISTQDMEEAVTTLLANYTAMRDKNSTKEQIEQSDHDRRKGHNLIAQDLKNKFNIVLPGFIIDFEEARNIAGVVRELKYLQAIEGPAP